MKMPPSRPKSIRQALSDADRLSDRFVHGGAASVCLGDLLRGTSFGGRARELEGRSVLLTARDQLAAALALIELDGAVRRLILCPPDITPEQLPGIIAKGDVDAIVSDDELSELTPANSRGGKHYPTEWVLLTSGTTGAPKMIVHNLATLTAAIDLTKDDVSQNDLTQKGPADVTWGTFYDIRRYGGLQIFLRAILQGGSLVLSGARLSEHGVTHLSGTPSHWRRALMSPGARDIAPRYVRLSGEIADQPILNALHAYYPQAKIAHAFASTEAGVAFEVNDGLAGFPSTMLGKRGEVEMKIVNDSLRIRSNRCALRYMDRESGMLADEEGFVDTGDIVERRGQRYSFLGRRNGVINVGGMKVYPEEVEAVINRHPAVRMSMVQPRRNPLTGSLVMADVVLNEAEDGTMDFRNEILEFCRQSLAPHKIPAVIRRVPALKVAAAGKMVRDRA